MGFLKSSIEGSTTVLLVFYPNVLNHHVPRMFYFIVVLSSYNIKLLSSGMN